MFFDDNWCKGMHTDEAEPLVWTALPVIDLFVGREGR